jgi:hypothetical protein
MLELRCPKHPTYRGIRRPRVRCSECTELWLRNDDDGSRHRALGWVEQGDGTWSGGRWAA